MKWPFVKIGNVCVKTTTRDPRRTPDDSFRYVDISSVDREQKLIVTAPEIIGSEAPSRARKEIKYGDVLVSTVRPNLNTVAMVPPELENQIASTGFCILRPKVQIDKNYLFYFTLSNLFVEVLTSKVRGAHYPAVSDSDVKNVKIPLPAPKEQRRIVEILDQADRLRKLRVETDKKAERILPALFTKMFGDPIQNISGERWPLKQFDSFSKVSYGLADRIDSSLTAKGGLRIITISNVKIDGSIDPLVEKYSPAGKKQIAKASVQEHDLLFNWRNGSKEHVGKTAIWENNWAGETLHVSFLLRIRPDIKQASPYYLWSLINLLRSTGFFVGQSRIQVNSKFNASELSALKVPLPPRENQGKYDLLVKQIRGISNTFNSREKEIEKIFSSLLHRAFSGDLTASWRQAHMKELLQEMELQAKALNN